MKKLFCLIIFLWIPSLLGAPIQKVEIEGSKRIEAAAIRSNVRIPQGAQFDKKVVKDAVQSVFGMGYFKDIKVYFDESTGILTFIVKEKIILTKVEFAGNNKLDTEDLQKEITIKPFNYVDPNRIRQDVEKIRKLYDKKGYYLTEINPDIQSLNEQEATLTFRIEERKKVEIRRISFIGNQRIPDDELKSVMHTREKDSLSWLTDSGSYQEEILNQDRQTLRDYYGHKGYIKAKVGQPRVQLTPDRESLNVTFSVEEGEPYKVGKVALDGEFIHPEEELRKKVKLKSGEMVDTVFIQQDLMNLATLYADDGYAYANVLPRDEYDDEKKIVNITYFLQPGPKVHIERIEFRGNETTRDKVLRREMRISEGDLYSATKIRESKQNIERLALYEDIRVSTPRGSADDKVNLVFEIKEKATGTFSIGAGFNTIESFQVIATVQKRNLFGYGVDTSLEARLGGKTQVFNLQYRDEYFLDTKFGMTINAFNIAREYSNFDLTTRGGSMGFDYPLFVEGLRRVRGGLTYSLSDEILTNIRPTVEALFKGGLSSAITMRVTYDTRNRVFEPTAGTYLEGTEQIAGGVLGGDNDFSKSEFDARWFVPVADGSTTPVIGGSVFAFHVGVGYVKPLRDGARVPIFERYFPGGILSLRGFPIRSLGPIISTASSSDPTGLVASDFAEGGNKQLILNAEYIFPILQVAGIKGVVFFDMGNAFDNGQSMFTLTGQRQSAGFGIRWFSPIGPLRFEWGFPLDKKKDEDPVVFDFTIGSLF